MKTIHQLSRVPLGLLQVHWMKLSIHLNLMLLDGLNQNFKIIQWIEIHQIVQAEFGFLYGNLDSFRPAEDRQQTVTAWMPSLSE